MSVFVDTLKLARPYIKADKCNRWKYKYFCHLMADDLTELHLFASKIGLSAGMFQYDPKYPHYDITAKKRRLAVQMGAVEKYDLELIQYFRNKRSLKTS